MKIQANIPSDTRKPRTLPQNGAIHLWFTQVAQKLNESGLTVQHILKKTVELNWTPILVKAILWKSVQVALLGKSSTTELKKTEDIEQVFEHLNRFLGEKFEVHVPFPSSEELEKIDPTFVPSKGMMSK